VPRPSSDVGVPGVFTMPDTGIPNAGGESKPPVGLARQLDGLLAALTELSRANRLPRGHELLAACPKALKHIRAALDQLADCLDAGRADLLAQRWDELQSLAARLDDRVRLAGETRQRAGAEIENRAREFDAESQLPPSRDLAGRLRDLTSAMSHAARQVTDELDTLAAAARTAARRAAMAGARAEPGIPRPHRDPDTGLDRRELFEERLALAVATAAFRRPWSLLLVDVDNQEDIARRHGVGPCDMLLSQVAQVVGLRVRQGAPGALVAASGEGRFAAILPGERADALAAADQVRLGVASVTWAVTSLQGQRDISTTASIGVASYRRGESLDDLTRRTNDAVRRARAQGANRIVLAEPDGRA